MINSKLPDLLIAPPGKIFVWDILYGRYHITRHITLTGDEDSIPPILLACGKLLPEYRATLYSTQVYDDSTVCSACIEAKGENRRTDNC